MSALNLLLLFLVLLSLAAMFSASETALFSLPRPRVKRFAQEPGPVRDFFRRLIQSPHQILVQIVLGNTLLHVAATATAAILLRRAVDDPGVPLWIVAAANTVGMTAVLLVACEVTPKTLALERNEALAPWFARFLSLFRPVLAPVAGLLEGLANVATRFMRVTPEQPLTVDELESLVELGTREGTLDRDESQLFRGAFRLGEKTVAEILVPRADVAMLPASTPVDEAMDFVLDARHTRLPVYEGTIDRVVGVLYVKDLLPWVFARGQGTTVQEAMRPPFFVPRDKRIEELLRVFQAERVHFAVVVDGEGRADGIVTLEDVLEEVVGNIQDGLGEEPAFRPTHEHGGVFLGTVPVSEANRLLDLRLPGLPGETLDGFVRRLQAEGPAEGEELAVDGARLVVEAVTGRTVWSVRVERA